MPRCQVHFSRNLQGVVGRSERGALAADLRAIFACPTREQAWELAHLTTDRWRVRAPRVAERIEEELEGCLACLAFPAEHQRRIRTTNGLERVSQELKRRTRVVRIFPNRAACLRLVTALAAELSDEWESGRRYLPMEEVMPDTPTTTTTQPAAIAAG